MPITGATGYASATAVAAPSSSLTDFTLLVDLSDMPSDWWNAFDAGGGAGSIRVTLSDGTTELPRDPINVVSNADGTGTGWLRVMWSGAQSSAPELRIYPDATGSYSATDTYGQHNSYASDVAMYQPLEEDPSGSAPQFLDRTSNDRDGTSAGSMTSGDVVSGKVGSAIDFDGSDDYIGCGSRVGPSGGFSCFAWINQDTAQTGMIASQYNAPGALVTAYFQFFVDSNGAVHARIHQTNNSGPETHIGRKTADSTIPSTQWRHVVFTWDGTTSASGIKIYVNGAAADNADDNSGTFTASNSNSIAARIGTQIYNGVASAPFDGKIDDVMTVDDDRSAAWVDYEYDQSNDNATFWGTWSWSAAGGGGGSISYLTLLGVG